MNSCFRFFVCHWMVFAATPIMAQLEGDPELFVKVGDAWRANFDAIETWQGKVTIQITYMGPMAATTRVAPIVSSAQFWYSKGEGALKRIVDTNIGTTRAGKPDIRRQSVLRLPDALYSLRMTYPNREAESPRTAMTVIESPEADRVAYATEDFDPLIWLRCEPFDVDQRMRYIYDNLAEFRTLWEEHPGVDKKILTLDGDIVTYTTLAREQPDDGSFDQIEFQFDLSKGGLPIHAL